MIWPYLKLLMAKFGLFNFFGLGTPDVRGPCMFFLLYVVRGAKKVKNPLGRDLEKGKKTYHFERHLNTLNFIFARLSRLIKLLSGTIRGVEEKNRTM